VSTFDLLYDNLKNNMIINSQIVGEHTVKNGVKQGDALSCTLFILAMEPLIRNIDQNSAIKQIESRILPFKWPKVLGYADDITCVIKNECVSKQAIFEEYEKFSEISGLVLNAEKTESYYFADRRMPDLLLNTTVRYMGQTFDIEPVDEIKINGVILCQDKRHQIKLNCNSLINKMDKHFESWSKRSLTLLGKIQIYKTYGMSQFLYHLANFEPRKEDWKLINKKVNMFLWNKNYNNNTNPAPARIRKEVLVTPVNKGGFGMIDLTEAVTAMRLRRFFYLQSSPIHPLGELLEKLTDGVSYLNCKPNLDVDEIVNLSLEALRVKRTNDCKAQYWELESDLTLHINLLNTKIVDFVRPQKLQSREMLTLINRDMRSLKDVILNQNHNLALLCKITKKEFNSVIKIIARCYRDGLIPDGAVATKLKDTNGSWVNVQNMPSRKLRDILYQKKLSNPKIMLLTEEQKSYFYNNLSKIVNVANKSRMLRLIYGDVYCGERLVRFNLRDDDTCRRCFGRETILHLLSECPYTIETFTLMGIGNNDIPDIVGVDLNKNALEIRADILGYLMFRQHIMPPKILVKTTFEKYSKGIVKRGGVQKQAKRYLRDIFGVTSEHE
jgi:hypothetical protein